MKRQKKYLNSFYPLYCNSKGIEAIKMFSLPKYIDGSCRREPDFENEFPCITGLCRPGFAEKLNIEDVIIYVTNKKGIGSRKVVAILEVIRTFENHRQAADWYINENKKIPNNLMVKETTPFDLNKTHQIHGINKIFNDTNLLKKWNLLYKSRSRKKEKVVQCEILYEELNTPISLDESKFKRKLTAQNPPIIDDEDWDTIKKLINI